MSYLIDKVREDEQEKIVETLKPVLTGPADDNGAACV